MNPLDKIGSALFQKGQKNLGKTIIRTAGKLVKATPVGGLLDDFGILEGIGDALGVPPTESDILHTIEASSPEQLAAMLQTKQLEADIAMAALNAETTAITSVNETIRQEVIANPAAGAWRPMWGRWSCVGFWSLLGILTILVAVDLIAKDGALLIPHLPMILTAITGVMILPASILGVASFHRGQEKKILAGEA
jgi:hypothetical protein